MSITKNVVDIIPFIRGLVEDKNRVDGRDSHIYESDSIFTITEDYISSSTIKVFVNGTEITTFTYNADNNQVTITSVLTENDSILITYDYYKKYSDVEIKGFLESSLVYFPMYQYEKVFEMNDNDEIVAVNDIDPTISELYIIAQVASILIDPQNVRIAIPDLTMSAKRDKSDQDQIKEVIAHFTNFVGTIDFEQYKI